MAVRQPTPMYIRRRKSASGGSNMTAEEIVQGMLPISYGDTWVAGSPASGVSTSTLSVWDNIDITTAKEIGKLLPGMISRSVFSGTLEFGVRGVPRIRNGSTIALRMKALPQSSRQTPAVSHDYPMARLLFYCPGISISGENIGDPVYTDKDVLYLPAPKQYTDALIKPVLAQTVLSVGEATGGSYKWPTTIDTNPWWDRYGGEMHTLATQKLIGPLGSYDILIEVDFDLTITHYGSVTREQTLTATETRYVANNFTPEGG